MKTLCAALVLLSLISVCQPAPLACEKLVKPVDQDPDMSGRWYLVALSAENCLVSTLVNGLLWPSISVNIISKEKPNHYQDITVLKIHGICFNETDSFAYANSSVFEVNSDDTLIDEPDVLLQTSCPDCLVVKEDTDVLWFISKRTAVTAAELKEFETQAECLGWSKPQILNTDHDYGNCKSYEDINEDDSSQVLRTFFQKMLERVANTHHMMTKCAADSFLSYFS